MPTTSRDVIQEVSLLLGDTQNTIHSISNMLTYLNRSLKDICNRAKCIREVKFSAVVADEAEYALPTDMLQVDVVAYSDGRFYPLQSANLKGMIRADYWYGGGQPRFFDIWGNARIERAIGTATGGSQLHLEDTAIDFLMPIPTEDAPSPGDLVLNQNDDSEAFILTVQSNRIDFTPIGLGGGADNLFEAGDTYQIISPHAPAKVLRLFPTPSKTDVVGAESLAVYYSRKHRFITQAMYDMQDDWLEIDEELEPALIHRTMFWAHAEEYGVDSNESAADLALYLGEYQSALPLIRRRMREFKSTWFDSLGVARSRRITGAIRNYPLKDVNI